MTELVPVLAGVLLGFSSRRLPLSLRSILLLVVGLCTGVLCSFIAGELSRSWVYVAVDSVQVVTSCLITRFLCAKAQHALKPRLALG